MITTCNECYDFICDFCKHYNFNGDEDGAYQGNGICTLDNSRKEPLETCDNFYCFNVDKQKGEVK